MRKGRDGGKREKRGGKNGKKKKRRMKIVATTSLPAVDRPNADRLERRTLVPMFISCVSRKCNDNASNVQTYSLIDTIFGMYVVNTVDNDMCVKKTWWQHSYCHT